MKNSEKNLDDIIFGERNKAYGAYQMRKGYSKNMVKALVAGILLFSSIISIPLIANYLSENDRVITTIIDGPIVLNPVKKDIIQPLPELPIEEKKTMPSLRNIITSLHPEIDLNIDDLFPPSNNTPVSDTAFIDIAPEPKDVVIRDDDDESKKIVIVPEEMPEFPGGDQARMKFMSDNITYPEMAHNINLQGTVYLTFVIEKDGSISGINVLRGVGGGCDEEAIRVISLMPKWKPGRQGGRAVRVQMNVPINFRLE